MAMDIPERSTPECPAPGLYRTRFVKNGPFIPCRIMHVSDGWLLLVNGQMDTPTPILDPWKTPRMEPVAFSPRIDEAEYERLLAESVGLDPFLAIDWDNLLPKDT